MLDRSEKCADAGRLGNIFSQEKSILIGLNLVVTPETFLAPSPASMVLPLLQALDQGSASSI